MTITAIIQYFKHDDLKKALKEMYDVLKPHGRVVLSYPTCEQIRENLREDERLRALCLSGSLPLKEYIKMITDVGFVCDKIAGALAALGRNDIFISDSTYFYDGGGCC